MNIKAIKQVETLEDLQGLGIGHVVHDISHRGGTLGFYGQDIARAVGVDAGLLSHKVGVYCNYLGGGIRGGIAVSGYNKSITGRKARLLDELCQACKRAYESVENEIGLNDDEGADGEPNWDSQATKAVRRSGIKRAY